MADHALICFNLVIEYLLISTQHYRIQRLFGWYCFNLVIEYLLISTFQFDGFDRRYPSGFNLVIEYLLISTSDYPSIAGWQVICFNLVIEYLLISTKLRSQRTDAIVLFQSRNRVSSNFNADDADFDPMPGTIVSIS